MFILFSFHGLLALPNRLEDNFALERVKVMARVNDSENETVIDSDSIHNELERLSELADSLYKSADHKGRKGGQWITLPSVDRLVDFAEEGGGGGGGASGTVQTQPYGGGDGMSGGHSGRPATARKVFKKIDDFYLYCFYWILLSHIIQS